MKKLTSRKFWILVTASAISVLLPVIYKQLEIDSSITLTSLGMINGLASIYFGANLLDKKMGE